MVTATQINPETYSGSFMQNMFGKQYLVGEQAVFSMMERLSKDYACGQWNMFELSNGGFLMTPPNDGIMKLEWAGNYFEGDMSAEAAGIVACLFVFNILWGKTQSDFYAERYHLLLDFAAKHKEAATIYRAID